MAARTTKSLPPLVRNLTLSALDTLAAKVAPVADEAAPSALQKLADAWRALSADDRDELLALTAAAGTLAVRAARKSVRRTAKAGATKKKPAKAATLAPLSMSEETPKKKKKGKDKKGKKKDKGKDRERKKDRKKKK
jgi:hypothetical protein